MCTHGLVVADEAGRELIAIAPDERFACDLAFLGNRLPDREARVEEFFLRPAASLADRQFLIGGNGWETKAMPANVRHRGHVYTAEHNAFNCTPRAVLNVARTGLRLMIFVPSAKRPITVYSGPHNLAALHDYPVLPPGHYP